MVDMFARDNVCEPGAAQLSYDELSAAFRADHAKRETDYASLNALVETSVDSTRLTFGRVAVIPAR
jgi:hypothetical protein